MIALIVILVLFAIILFMGMIADNNIENRRNFTYGFCTVILALAAIVILKM